MAEPAVELRLATLAPSGSSWMKVFNAWNLTIKEQTDNTLKLRFYDGGSQGDERDFVRKIRAGQLDGAALTTTGLGILVRQVLVLSAPGVIEDYEQLDSVRAELGGRFQKMFDDRGVHAARLGRRRQDPPCSRWRRSNGRPTSRSSVPGRGKTT